MDHHNDFDLHEALNQIEYLNLIIVSAAAAPERLPYVQSCPDIDLRRFQQQMGSLVCLLQTHLADLSAALRQPATAHGRFADFQVLIADTVTRLQAGAPVQATLHRHLHNLFAFDQLVHADQAGAHGLFIRHDDNDLDLAQAWLNETLSCIECGFKLHELLGEAQNTDVCNRLCFGEAVSALETWRRDLQFIMPGTISIM